MAGRQILQRLRPMAAAYLRTGAIAARPVSRLAQTRLTQVVQSTRFSAVRSLCSTAPKFECINIQDEDDFKKRVVESQQPVVVDFYATWCGPCKLLGPRLESIIASKEGKVILAKVDIDMNTELAMHFGVTSVPTVIGVKNGKVHEGFIGLQEDDVIDGFVERLM